MKVRSSKPLSSLFPFYFLWKLVTTISRFLIDYILPCRKQFATFKLEACHYQTRSFGKIPL